MVGDDWTAALPKGGFAFCLTHTGPEADPAIHAVMARLAGEHAVTYGIAHYPRDAKDALPLIEFATKQLQTSSVPITAPSR